MTLRLTGEEFSVVRGLDGLGYLRSIQPSDASPGLKVQQSGTGPILELWDGTTKVVYMNDGGALVSERDMDVRSSLKNLGSAHYGRVYIEDDSWVTGTLFVQGQLAATDGPETTSGGRVFLDGSTYVVRFYRRLTTFDPDTDWCHMYFYKSGTTRQMVFKMNDGGTTYTATLDLV